MHKWILVSGGTFALLSVIIGAFAAHGLKHRLDEYALGIIQIATQYQMSHALALLMCGIFSFQLKQQPTDQLFWLKLSAVCFTFGIIFFSGSLYALAITGQKWLGPITPFGGLLFILGWLSFIINAIKS